MKKFVALFAFIVITITSTNAQDYNWAVGTRIGGAMSGISAKHFISPLDAVEVILAIPYKKGFNLTGLYERHIPVISEGFHFYYGAGAHIGTYNEKFLLGVDGIIGLEYKIPTIPLALSLDYKPMLDLVSETKFRLEDFGLGIKVVF